jgi:NTP pyrophosphatase (non-canonical NTP hydrolase)
MTAINRIEEVDIHRFETFPEANIYQEIAIKSAIYPGHGTMMGLSYCAHKLAGEAGELNEHFGKAMRDDGLFAFNPVALGGGAWEYNVKQQPLTEARKQLLIKEVGDCLWYLSAICKELGITLGRAMLTNLWKLHDRTNRNALQGSGDDR